MEAPPTERDPEDRSRPEIVPAGEEGLERTLVALDLGQIVVIPTDTVYGLAARLDRPEALEAVFAAKDRPPGLALPVMIGRWRQVHQVAADWPRAASMLAARFWPGALTVVVPVRDRFGPLLGGDGSTVGLRCPDHRWVRTLCRRTGPLAVTSANRHGKPPATTAEEAAAAFDADAVALVVDGGRCEGVPSTVVDCVASPPACLREGGLAWSWIEAAVR